MSDRGGRPRIGVATAENGGWFMWTFCRLGVRLAGGSATRLTPKRKREEERFDGLLLTGGSDIEPQRYGALSELGKQVARAGRGRSLGSLFRLLISALIFLLRVVVGVKGLPLADPRRDDFELALLHAALENGTPLLGTCRGMQLMNVALGGSLHQEIAEFYQDVGHPHTVLPLKTVHLAEGSRLEAIYATKRLRVNALHHQAIDRTGEGISITARDEAGVAQALEREGKTFVVGVQWHPEFLLQYGVHRRIFRAFVDAARAAREPRETRKTRLP